MQKSCWPPNIPESLTDLCLHYCVQHLDKTLCTPLSQDSCCFHLKSNVCLPSLIGDAILKVIGSYLSRQHLGLLIEPDALSLKQIDVRNISDLTDDELQLILKHKLSELRLSSRKLTKETISHINSASDNLTTLFIVNCPGLFENNSNEDDDVACVDLTAPKAVISPLANSCDVKHPAYQRLLCSKLRWLAVREADNIDTSLCRSIFNRPFLMRLDLSDSQISLSDLHAGLKSLNSLQILSLHNVHLDSFERAVEAIANVKSLRSLDLGQSRQETAFLYEKDVSLKYLVSSLPQLTWLDISGTNLAGWISDPVVNHRPTPECESSRQNPIPGLEGRHFDYLGLLNCAYTACERQNLPAAQVTGHANEDQILLSVVTYIERNRLLLLSLNHLFHLFKYSQCNDHKKALDGILAAMHTYLEDRAIQISGSASLFYIVKSRSQHYFSTKLKRFVINTLLDAMEKHIREPTVSVLEQHSRTMLRNGCLTMCHFRIPHDVMYCYRRMVELLLKVIIAAYDPIDNFIQRIVVYLLNSLSCQVDHSEKQLVGELGAFPTMLKVIRERVERGLCDEIMEVSWSMLWNVTDETAINCERFIKESGLETFMDCLEKFKNQEELLRNMMGLLGNVAEVDYLRHHLMAAKYVTTFSDLLSSKSDGIEVSYNACGVLAHMMSDGPQAWRISSPTRQSVLQKMRSAILQWNLKSRRNINYRSFKPILRLIPCYDAPESQHWAIWALCNLTKVYKNKYCPLVETDGGLEMLADFCADTRSPDDVKYLAHKVINRCRRYRLNGSFVSDDDHEPSMDINDD